MPSPASHQPPSSANGDFTPRLRRLCALLGVSGGRLASHSGDDTCLTAMVGRAAANLKTLDARAMRDGTSLILSDTGASGPDDARFYLGMVLPGDTDRPPALLSLYDARPRSALFAERAARIVADVMGQAAHARQQALIEAHQRTIDDYAALETLRRSLFDRASATAKIGIWQCNLADNSVTWTNGIYDLFEIERNVAVTREMALALYSAESRAAMEQVRAQAIATCSDFSIDCQIVTMTGKPRWMRLTGAVESRDGVAHRIFGMKQDITEEKLFAERTRYMAEHDLMTNLANRALFQSRLTALDAGEAAIGALLLIDLDGFKQVNDTHGHAMGDECLKQAAQRLTETVPQADLVARIGGDEFAVLLPSNTSLIEAEFVASQIVASISKIMQRGQQHLTLGASVGVAPYRGGTAEDLFQQADMALYAAKAAGRKTHRTFDGDAKMRRFG